MADTIGDHLDLNINESKNDELIQKLEKEFGRSYSTEQYTELLKWWPFEVNYFFSHRNKLLMPINA